jgi:hypothetical protein
MMTLNYALLAITGILAIGGLIGRAPSGGGQFRSMAAAAVFVIVLIATLRGIDYATFKIMLESASLGADRAGGGGTPASYKGELLAPNYVLLAITGILTIGGLVRRAASGGGLLFPVVTAVLFVIVLSATLRGIDYAVCKNMLESALTGTDGSTFKNAIKSALKGVF